MKRKKVASQQCNRCEEKFPEDRSQCPHCGHWNVEGDVDLDNDGTLLLSEVQREEFRRIQTGPWDIAFGKDRETNVPGIVTTSVTLLGGAPGAGKSTTSIQICDAIAKARGREAFYIGAEEGKAEYAERAARLKLDLSGIRIYPMGARGDIAAILKKRRPSAVVVDSLPGLTNDPAEAAIICKNFKDIAVELDAPVIIIDHVTKDGDLAGLMELQHHVDTLLTMFPVQNTEIRDLSVMKNRFGVANFSTYLLMTGEGLIALPDDMKPEEDEDG